MAGLQVYVAKVSVAMLTVAMVGRQHLVLQLHLLGPYYLLLTTYYLLLTTNLVLQLHLLCPLRTQPRLGGHLVLGRS